MCLLMNYPIGTHIPDKISETVIQTHLLHIYAMFGGYLSLITDNGKELKNEFIQNVTSELRIKHQF